MVARPFAVQHGLLRVESAAGIGRRRHRWVPTEGGTPRGPGLPSRPVRGGAGGGAATSAPAVPTAAISPSVAVGVRPPPSSSPAATPPTGPLAANTVVVAVRTGALSCSGGRAVSGANRRGYPTPAATP